MNKIDKIHVTPGIYWVSIPKAQVYIQCGCPADSVKFLMKRGLIVTREENGRTFDSGPNVILLSDHLIQGGDFANLAEFPVLQMLYRQGMIIPGHPGNSGVKPLLAGSREQVYSQLEYIYRGNYGLTSEEEIVAAGVDPKVAQKMMSMKLKFAFGKIKKTDELLDSLIIEDEEVEIRNGVFIKRKLPNIFEIRFEDQTVEVDLNLRPHEEYDIPFNLSYHNIRREYFAVIHSGEGDGWDFSRPCMGSILVFQGKLFLIDAGPNITHSLMALGIGINEIEGIFHTHAHDDHFAGLTTIMRSDHKIKYFATPLVRASVAKKLSALVSMKEEEFSDYFDVYDLNEGEWNKIEGLEVRPVNSPHPVETTFLLFRTYWDGGQKVYAHLADIAGLDVLKNMISEDESIGISQSYYEEVCKQYLGPADLKKIDIGGGPIHGQAEDFREDKSDKIILSHTSFHLTSKEKEIGSGAPFGMVDVMIPAYQNFAITKAFDLLQKCFPNTPGHQVGILLNNPIKIFNPETILIKNGVVNDNIYLILSGNVEALNSGEDFRCLHSAGSFVGELSGMKKSKTTETFRAMNFVNTLQIPSGLFLDFIKHNSFYEDFLRLHRYRSFTQRTWILGDIISSQVQNRIAENILVEKFSQGHVFENITYDHLCLTSKGSVQLIFSDGFKEHLSPGGFWGEEGLLYNFQNTHEVIAQSDLEVFKIPKRVLLDIPIIHYKLFETYKERQIHNICLISSPSSKGAA